MVPSCGAARSLDSTIGRLIVNAVRPAGCSTNSRPEKLSQPRREMIAANEQREGHPVIVVEGDRGQAETCRCVPAALGSRVGFHDPDSTDLDGGAVNRSRAD